MTSTLRRKSQTLKVFLVMIGLSSTYIAQAQVAPVTLPLVPGSGVARIRKMSYTNSSLSNLSSSSFLYDPTALCSTGGPVRARRVVLVAKFSANTLVDPGAGLPSSEIHNMGSNVFSGSVRLQLGANAGPAPYAQPIQFTISNAQPEQSFVLDLTTYFNTSVLAGPANRITTTIVPGSYTPANPNFRLSITLEESYDFAVPTIALPPDIVRTDGSLEQNLSWTSSGCLAENYQVQLLKLTEKELLEVVVPAQATALQNNNTLWGQRATTLDVQTSTANWRTTLAEGYGTYYYRIRAIANAPGGVVNPENWGSWSNVAKITLSGTTLAPGITSLADLNWIYSRTFTEGGRVAEKITFANGLLQPRQTLTRLASTQQIIGLQTLQDFVGRDALQSLPIPVSNDQFLMFKPNLLQQFTSSGAGGAVYQAANFDDDALVSQPSKANERNYYSSTAVYATPNPPAGTAPLNEGVADAEGYPFARTLFSRDGTNRVREQGSAGAQLGIKPSLAHTVRTYYASVAQSELRSLMGKEAPLADKTYKIITTDPNDISTVSYQTQDGKTVATALAGAGTGGNLQPLVSAPGQGTNVGTTIQETLTDKVDFNGIGSVGRKILVVTEPTTITVKYTIDSKTFADDCEVRCSTCDYRVTVIGYNLDEPTVTTELFPPIMIPMQSAKTCPAPVTSPEVTGSYAVTTPGTYVIEKKVTSYNSATGATTTYLDDQIQQLKPLRGLQHLYDDYSKVQPWIAIKSFVNPTAQGAARDIEGLYDFLATPNNTIFLHPVYVRETANGQDFYKVPFGCDDKVTESFIKIPVLQSNCGPRCVPGNPQFAQMFTARWDGQPGRPLYQVADALPGFTPAQFDAMVAQMLADTAPFGYQNTGYRGKCDQLRDCWMAQVESYDELLKAAPAGTTSIDLGQEFLECAWSLLQPPRDQTNPNPVPRYVPAPYITKVVELPLAATDRYRYVAYDPSTPWPATVPPIPQPSNLPPFHLACLRSALDRWALSTLDVNATFLASLTPTEATAFYEHSRGAVSAPTPANPMPFTTTAQAAANLVTTVQAACEDRRGEFRQSVLAYIRDPANNIATGSIRECEIDLLANELVQKCRLDAVLTAVDFEPITTDPTVPQPVPLKMTEAAGRRLARIMNGSATVALRALPNATCQPGFESCPLTADEFQQGLPFKLAPAVFELINYTNEFLRRGNAIRQAAAVTPRVAADLIGCPASGIGFGERNLNTFSLIAPLSYRLDDLSHFSGLLAPDPAPGRRNSWVSMTDVNGNQGIALYFLAKEPNGTLNDPGNVCVPMGDDAPGVPKLPTLAQANGGYNINTAFYIIDPVSRQYIDLYTVTDISRPYLKAGTFDVTDTYRFSSQGTYVMVTTTQNGVTSVGEYEVARRPGSASTEVGLTYHMSVAWRVVNECPGPRTYAACLKWNDFVPLITSIPVGLPAPFTVPSCQDVVAQQIAANIQTQQQQWVNERLTNYRARYAATCAAPAALSDRLNMSYTLGYHHFTLYYYDRGGNLMKTVPPAGIRPLLAGDDYPIHQLETNYRYNSLGQLVKQTTPDGGTTDFFYNRKGQLRYSLNDKQRAAGKYSYTAYDALGRVEQVGESTFLYSPTLEQPLANIETLMVPPTGNSSVTRTVYNLPATGLTYLNAPDAGQRYLTNRVSYTATSDGAQTSYSYDPHGNVEWLAQDVPGLERKFVRYAYDLISNKVLQVDYQAGQPDQFFHRYRYDDDNRLLAVETSADNTVWEQDANYQYYAHGPLKRTVLGDDQVQALDYAYTLQGWLKAVNHPNLTTATPLTQAAGQDGQSNGVAADAFGMVLGYYRGDYARTGTYLDAGPGTAQAKVLREPTATQELFNGNIATWSSRTLETTAGTPTQTGPPAAETYRYDQLNRLLSGQRSTYNAGSQTWGTASATSPYSSRYSYDANGNLQTLGRNTGTSSQLLDDLTYRYDPANANRLKWVTDKVPDTRSTEDVDNQAIDNYNYDEVGNLTSDVQAGVGAIAWTPYGKIANVTRFPLAAGGDKPFTAYVYDAQGNRISKATGVTSAATTSTTATTYYVRDAQGNPLAVYERQTPAGGPPALRLREQALYGSARLGLRQPNLALVPGQALPAATGYYARVLGQKAYELTDHLGNVRAVVSDEKTSTLGTGGTPLASSLRPVLGSFYNYYPFGQLQPGRYAPSNATANSGYRYGYNGKEKDNNGELGLTTYDYGFRIYNPGLGRFLSVDPLAPSYPWFTPYQFAGNIPIANVDKDGQEMKWFMALLDYFGYSASTINQHSDDVEEESRRQSELANRRASLDAFTKKLEKQLEAEQAIIGVIPGASLINGSVNYSIGRASGPEAAGGVVMEAGLVFVPMGRWPAKVAGKFAPMFLKDVGMVLEGLAPKKYLAGEITTGFVHGTAENRFKSAIRKITNNLASNIRDQDVSALIKEIHGANGIPLVMGKNHIGKVEAGLTGLRNASEELSKLISKGELQGEALQEAIRARQHADDAVKLVDTIIKDAKESAK